MSWWTRLSLRACIVAALTVFGCTERSELDELRAVSSGLTDEEFAAFTGPLAGLEALSLRIGPVGLNSRSRQLGLDIDDTETRLPLVRHWLARVDSLILVDFGKVVFRYVHYPNAVNDRNRARHQEILQLGKDSTDPRASIARAIDLARRFEAEGFARHSSMALTRIARDAAIHNLDALSDSCAHAAVDIARELGMGRVLGQNYGSLGYRAGRRGDVATRDRYYAEGLAAAEAVHDGFAVNRIRHLMAVAALQEGRIVDANEHASAGLDWGLRYEEPFANSNALGTAISFFERTESWMIVGSLVDQLDALGTEDPEALVTVRARVLAATTGDVAAAHRQLQTDADPYHRATDVVEVVPDFLSGWAAMLHQHRWFEESIPLLTEARDRYFAGNMRQRALRAGAGLSLALLRSGRPGDAHDAARAFRDSLAVSEVVVDPTTVDLVEAELALADERTDDARTLLVDLVNRRLADLAITDPHAISYLELDIDRTIMRSAALLVDDAESYDLELARRSLPQVLGARARPTAPPAGWSDLESLVRTAGSRVRAWTAETNAVHVMFRVDGGTVTRWVVENGTVTEDVLPLGLPTLRARIADVQAVLDPADDAPLSSVGVRRLHDLGTDLLPPSAWSAPTVLVTSDGVLDLVPFAALSGRAEFYTPLVATTDVGRLRAFPLRSPKAGRGAPTSLVIDDPDLPVALLRRYPQLRPLEGSRREAALAHSMLRNGSRLSGSRATRSSVVQSWADRSRLYVAAHVLRLVDRPFVTFIPLADEGGASGRISVLDIRRTSFTARPEVVLAGCGSGAPDIEAYGSTPSLADAFIDAGAASVVQALWRVSDKTTPTVTSVFLEEWVGNGRGVVEALSRARRVAFDRHPRVWAAFDVELGNLPD